MYLKIFKGNNLQEIGTESRDQTVEIGTIQEITTGIEIEKEVDTMIKLKIEITAEINIELGLTQEMEEIEKETSKDLEKVTDTLTRLNSVTTVTEQVI